MKIKIRQAWIEDLDSVTKVEASCFPIMQSSDIQIWVYQNQYMVAQSGMI